jgi:hypothetical protein
MADALELSDVREEYPPVTFDVVDIENLEREAD